MPHKIRATECKRELETLHVHAGSCSIPLITVSFQIPGVIHEIPLLISAVATSFPAVVHMSIGHDSAYFRSGS